MDSPIADQVIDFYQSLFERIFSAAFRSQITERLKSNMVTRQVQEAADAASQSLIRFFVNQSVSEQQTAQILAGFEQLSGELRIAHIANPNVTPESVVEQLLRGTPLHDQETRDEATSRVALHSVVQVLMLVGPVMAEWQKIGFSRTFELPRRIVDRLNQISEQLGKVGRSGDSAGDQSYELTYRDYLLQRFHRVEAGTLRMTVNLDVDLRELFVMPRLRPRPTESKGAEVPDPASLMPLRDARALFRGRGEQQKGPNPTEDGGIAALKQIETSPRLILVGVAGSGKSTCLEWLQLKLAAAEHELVMNDQQAIPLLLRLRQLDPRKLPRGAALIENATASKDRAALMPSGWIERQMQAGRVFFMLDGLDETEPSLRDQYVLPWLEELCRAYPNCRYLVSSGRWGIRQALCCA
jgi:NACHT domain-containing protein